MDSAPRDASDRPWAQKPSASALEDASGYTLTLDIPGIDPDAVEVLASFGVLTVRVAKLVPAQPRRVPVNLDAPAPSAA